MRQVAQGGAHCCIQLHCCIQVDSRLLNVEQHCCCICLLLFLFCNMAVATIISWRRPTRCRNVKSSGRGRIGCRRVLRRQDGNDQTGQPVLHLKVSLKRSGSPNDLPEIQHHAATTWDLRMSYTTKYLQLSNMSINHRRGDGWCLGEASEYYRAGQVGAHLPQGGTQCYTSRALPSIV